MLRRSGPELDIRLTNVQQYLETAAGSLRWLVDGHWPFLRPETGLTSALQERTAWLLAEPITVSSDSWPAQLHVSEVPDVVDVVELVLLAMVPVGVPARAHLAVQARGDLIEVDLTLASTAEDDQMPTEWATAKESLERLAAALRAAVCSEFRDQTWRAQFAVRREQTPPPR